MNLPTNDQVQAFLRHVYTAVGSGVAVATVLGVSQNDVEEVTTAVRQIGEGTALLIGGIAAIVPIISGFFAARRQSPVQQAKNIVKSQDLDIAPLTPQGVELIERAKKLVKSIK